MGRAQQRSKRHKATWTCYSDEYRRRVFISSLINNHVTCLFFDRVTCSGETDRKKKKKKFITSTSVGSGGFDLRFFFLFFKDTFGIDAARTLDPPIKIRLSIYTFYPPIFCWLFFFFFKTPYQQDSPAAPSPQLLIKEIRAFDWV